jgi:mannose-6-phosphate isomerase-like protein (cupin superfamily)
LGKIPLAAQEAREGKMKTHNLFDIQGTEYPAGRLTRVIVGPNAPLEADRFVMGHVTIYPGGSIPLHTHEQEEVYLIQEGEGVMCIGDRQETVQKGSCVYMDPNAEHGLRNTSSENLVLIFCYAPKGIVDHWKQELEGSLK